MAGFRYPREAPHWVVAEHVKAASSDGMYVDVTFGGKVYRDCRVTWHNPYLDKTKSDVLVEDEELGWLFIEFIDEEVEPYGGS